MNTGRPPRGRGLILALAAVLTVMGFAFWRAVAGSGAPRAPGTDVPGAPNPIAAAPDAPDTARGDSAPATADQAPARAQANGGSPGPIAAPSPVATPRPHAREMDEPRLMARLRALKDSDPASAVTLARLGNSRFPDSADAPERTSILIHALVAVDKGSEARGEAEQIVNHYPDSPWVREVERFTGAHRHRNVSVSDAGQLIFR